MMPATKIPESHQFKPLKGDSMKRVTGIGGIFFKSEDAPKLRDWYKEHLGVDVTEWGGAIFNWREAEDPEKKGLTVWSIFPSTSKYLDPSTKPFMINYRVENLDELIAQLREEGVVVEDKIMEEENGRFTWVMDPDGNRIELWEPAPGF
jgi:predicted enzyme related to lactoylglutathione lyase